MEEERYKAIIDSLAEKVGFDEDERRLVGYGGVRKDAVRDQVMAFTNIYLTNTLEGLVNRVITSSEKLEQSNDRTAKAMNWLTAVQ